MTRFSVLPDAEAAARHTADTVAWRIADARHAGRDVHIALAGGTTPRRVYELLREIEESWSHVHLWLGDERCVPAGDERSNAAMVRDSLYGHAPPSSSVFHELRRPEQPDDAAWLYGTALREHVPDLVLDVVLLGLGPDGHVASLFAGHHQLTVTEAPCVAVRDAPKPPPERVTLTLPVLRRARHTLLLACGPEKADAVRRTRDRDPAIPGGLLGDGLDEIVCDRTAATPG